MGTLVVEKNVKARALKHTITSPIEIRVGKTSAIPKAISKNVVSFRWTCVTPCYGR
jgi:hypothetical protein